MTDKKQAIENLKKLIAEQKARIDPGVLAKASAAAAAKHAAKLAPKPVVPSKPETKEFSALPIGSIPYDKEAAAKAVELFLKNHDKADDFSKKLLQFMKGKSQ